MHALKGLELPCASHSGEIAQAGSRRLRPTLAAAPVRFAHAVVKEIKNSILISPTLCRSGGTSKQDNVWSGGGTGSWATRGICMRLIQRSCARLILARVDWSPFIWQIYIRDRYIIELQNGAVPSPFSSQLHSLYFHTYWPYPRMVQVPARFA